MAKRKTRIDHAEIVGLFASRLREVRRSRGMTQADLARAAQVTVSYIGRLEGSGAAPGIDLVDRLARALGTTASDLIPAAAPAEPLAVLRVQARTLFEGVLKTADRETLTLLNPLLALLMESPVRRR